MFSHVIRNSDYRQGTLDSIRASVQMLTNVSVLVCILGGPIDLPVLEVVGPGGWPIAAQDFD